jgi:hypothetical protein
MLPYNFKNHQAVDVLVDRIHDITIRHEISVINPFILTRFLMPYGL